MNTSSERSQRAFQGVAARVVLDKLHLLRRRGNRAAHAKEGTTDTAIAALSEALDLARWLHGFLGDGAVTALGSFDRARLTAETSKSQLQRDKKALLIQFERQEAMLADVLTKLDAERAHRQQVEATVVELETYRVRAHAASESLGFKEADTRRRLIDTMLVDAGWQVGAAGKATDQVQQEVKLSLVPDEKGNGFEDYVLFGDDGKPLAVVEANRTAKDSAAGGTQAWLYAQALERQYGKRPVMFYTNGIDVMLLDDRSPSTIPRKLYGFYSKKSLEFLFYPRAHRDDKLQVAANPAICDRIYQLQAIKAVTERFATGHPKALLVLATGTGKTRIAASISDLLMRANWAKRILFLCDRKELRKQANDAFAEFLPDVPRIIVSRATAADRDPRIYFATYPAMAKCYTAFDVGFFDLIIADESHRSIYNRYRELLRCFDAMQIGLTATPRSVMSHQTYTLFGCEDDVPTFGYDYPDAISNTPAYLVPFRVVAHTTQFLRDGMRWADLSDDGRCRWEEQEPDAVEGGADVDAGDMDRQVLNKDTARKTLGNPMEHGLRDASGSRPGKTIVFARGHHHAVLLAETFGELYPQYGGDFCQVIDSHDDRAELLLSQFKDPASNLTIAMSVDMLDTGIDVPQVVNLLFAKPARSYVNFWQMIGRGTRLCPGLFGPGLDKKEFLIFDHWGNFDWFDEKHAEADEPSPRSLMQRVFEVRIDVAAAAQEAFDDTAFQAMAALLLADLEALVRAKSIRVRDRWRELHALANSERLYQDPFTRRHPESVDGMFPEAGQVGDLLDILQRFNAGELPAQQMAGDDTMITTQAKNQVDQLWTLFWTGGITNPLTVIEQVSYLFFLRLLDIAETNNERMAQRSGKSFRKVYAGADDVRRWSSFKHQKPNEMLKTLRDQAFPHLKELADDQTTFGKYLKDAQFLVPTASLLAKAVEAVEKLKLQGDAKGDLYEYLLSKLSTAGINGQFRTPRHIIATMVGLVEPKPTETIGDPSCGTGGFLVGAMDWLRKHHTSPAGVMQDEEGQPIYSGDLLEGHREHIQHGMLHGFDFDATMLRIAAMNLMLHGVDNPDVHYQDSLSGKFSEKFPRQRQDFFDVILANPPFKGNLDASDVHPHLLRQVKTRKTELLFVALILAMLKNGGRSATIVPDGVLFGSSGAHVSLRKLLVDDNQLEAVVSLPPGVFRPYAGVSTAILVFAKGGRTDEVFFYDVQADGFSLDDKRNAQPEKDDLPDLVVKWREWQATGKLVGDDRGGRAFLVPVAEIREKEHDLAINRYKVGVHVAVEHEKPSVILERMVVLEQEIMRELAGLQGAL